MSDVADTTLGGKSVEPVTAGAAPPLAVIVLLSSAPAMALIFGALGSILPLIATHFEGQGDPTFIAQMVMTMPAVGVLLGGLIGGPVVERLGVRTTLLAALGLYAAAGSSGLFLDGLWPLLASRFLMGVAVTSLSTSVMLLVGAWFEGPARARLLGLQQTCGGIASVAALLVSGALANWAGWRAPFAIYLAALAVLAVAAVVIPSNAVRPAERSRAADIKPLLALWPIYALQLPLFLAYFMTSVQFAFLLQADGVSNNLTRAIVIAVGVLAGAGSGAVYARVFGRLGERRTPLAMMGLMALGFLIIGTAGRLPAIAFGCALAGAGGGMISPFISGRLLASASDDIRPRALGLMFTTIYAADFLNPVLVKPVRRELGIHAAYLVVAGLLAIGALALWRRARRTI
ncbi:MAG TPA: MFS transporter [Alphaproteobacteria bacterium]|nr:MFS transporter [Alphaproteobacteria bacterium]